MTSAAALRAALMVETLKLRRSVVARLATVLLVVLVPLGSVGMVALARSPQAAGPTAAKLADYATGDLATTHLMVCAQVLSVAALAAGGFFVAWSFGRELESGTAGALFGLAVPRGTIALAKCLVALAWIAACVALTVAVTVATSAVVVTGADAPFEAWAGVGTALLALLDAPQDVIALVFAMIAGLLLTMVVTIWWKVSVHTAVASGVVSILAVAVSPWALLGYAVVAAIAWSRASLRDHTPAQTIAGALLGAVAAVSVFTALR